MEIGARSHKVISNTLIQVGGKGITSLLGVITVGILTRYLGVDNYGVYMLAFAYLSFFQAFSDLGLSLIGVREIAKHAERTKEILEAVLVVRFLLALIAVGLAIGLSYIFYPGAGREVLRIGIAIVAAASFISILGSAPITLYQARLQMIYATVSDIAGRAVAFTLMLVVVWQGYSLLTLFWTTLLSYGVTAAVNFWFARDIFNRFPRPGLALTKQLLYQAAPLGLALVVNTIYFRVDSVILSLFRSNTEVGLYSLSYRVLEIITIFFGYFTVSAFPLLSSYIENDPQRFREVVQKAINFILIASAPTVAGVILISRQIIVLLGGHAYLAAQPSLQILALATGMMFVNGFLGFMIIAANRQRSALWLNFTALAVNILLNIILIPQYGFIAAAYVTLISEIIIFVFALGMVHRFLSFLPNFGILWRVIPATLLMSAAVLAVESIFPYGLVATTVVILTGAIVYSGCVLLLRILTIPEVLAVTRLNRIFKYD